MRLALKLVLVFMLVNAALAGIYAYFAVKHEVLVFKDEVQEEATVVERLIVATWKAEDGAKSDAALARICGQSTLPLRPRWVDLKAVADNARPMVAADLLTPEVLDGHLAVAAAEDDGTGYFAVYFVEASAPAGRNALELAHSTTALTNSEHTIIAHTIVLVAGMALISALLAVILGIRFVGRPLEQLIAKARRMAGGDFQGPVQIRTHDELQELAEDLNAMCAKVSESQQKLREETAARIAALEQLRHADRLKTVGRLASGIAHELGTPLNVVSGRAGLIASGKLDSAEIAQSAAAIRAEADKMTSIIRQLLDFARSSTPHKQPADLGSVVRQTIDLLGAIAEKQNVRLQFQPQAEPALAEIDTGQIQQVLANLTMNAIQAMPHGGAVEFRIDRRTCRHPDNGGKVASYFAIEVQDHGTGIPQENLSQLFEPFFTTKEVGAGTGLGLSIAYGIVQEHGGWIEVASRLGEGSRFSVFLPAKEKP